MSGIWTGTGASSPVATARRRFAWLAAVSAVYTYLLIVFGGVVRITGSGLGCGDDWPKCHGVWIPTFDLATFIEWFHRLLAAGLILPFGALLFLALRWRREPGFSGRGGLLRPSVWIMALLVVQALLGALTVKLELPAAVTAMHFGLASVLLAIIIFAMVRAARPVQGGGWQQTQGPLEARAAAAEHGASASPAAPESAASASAGPARRWGSSALAATVLGFVVIIFGAFTANLGKAPDIPGAGPAAWACGVVDGAIWRSFPLCNGQLVPEGGGLVHTHWTHRLLAVLLLFHVLGAAIVAYRRGAPRAVAHAALAALLLIVLQFVVAAKLVFMYLPLWLQSVHLAVGVAVWAALVAWTALAKQADRAAASGAARSPAASREPPVAAAAPAR